MNLKRRLLNIIEKIIIKRLLRHAENQIDLHSYDKELSRKIDALRYLLEVK